MKLQFSSNNLNTDTHYQYTYYLPLFSRPITMETMYITCQKMSKIGVDPDKNKPKEVFLVCQFTNLIKLAKKGRYAAHFLK